MLYATDSSNIQLLTYIKYSINLYIKQNCLDNLCFHKLFYSYYKANDVVIAILIQLHHK